MVKFTGAYPLDFIYIKVEKSPIAWSLPLCEVLNGQLDSSKLSRNDVVLVETVSKKEWVYSRLEFAAMLKRALEKDQLPFCGEIIDFALQPADNTINEEVFNFLEKYD